MEYVSKIDKYVEDCQNSVDMVNEIYGNHNLDITLTTCEKFDHLFKREFVKIHEAVNRKTFFKRNPYKGKTFTSFVAQMFYLILITSDNYNFDVLQKVIQRITKLASRRKYTAHKVHFELTDNENKYILKVVLEGDEPLSYSIEDKQTYVVCLANLLTLCFAKSKNKMVLDYYKDYLQHEIMKIESGTQATPYVEWGMNLRLCDYFEPTVAKEDTTKKVKKVESYVQSPIDIATYERIRSTSDELLEGKKKAKKKGI